LRALAAEEVPRVSALRADVPAELDAFIASLLSRDPNQRPASAELAAERLSTWAGGDLAARIANSPPLPPGGAGEGSSNDPHAAQQSLCELLGAVPATSSGAAPAQPAPATAQQSGRGRGRNVFRVAAALAGFGAIFLGIVVLIKLRDSTLRIESDADTVQVDEDQITLQQGEKVVARISREQDATSAAVTPERIYRGKPESEWQRLFQAEVDPKARKDAAQALLNLAAQKPAEQAVEQLLGIGEDLMRSEAASNSLEFVFEVPVDDYFEMYNEIWEQLQKQPLPTVVTALGR
jgi:hypothetical protein